MPPHPGHISGHSVQCAECRECAGVMGYSPFPEGGGGAGARARRVSAAFPGVGPYPRSRSLTRSRYVPGVPNCPPLFRVANELVLYGIVDIVRRFGIDDVVIS